MRPAVLMHAALSLALGAGVTGAAAAADFSDRALLIETFSLDEAAPLAAAQAELAAAEEALAAAEEALALANAAVPPDPAAIAAAQADVLAKSAVRDEKAAAVAAIDAELAATAELVGQLSDRQVHALNAALQNARKTGLLPLDLDADELTAILEGGWGMPEIAALTHAYEAEARFDRLSLRFLERAEATGDERFALKAERFAARGDAHKDRFLAKAEAQAERREAREAEAEHPGQGLAKGKGH